LYYKLGLVLMRDGLVGLRQKEEASALSVSSQMTP